MILRLTADGQGHFVHGSAAKLELDGIDISQYVSEVTVLASGSDPLEATIKVFLTGLEIEVPPVIKTLLHESNEAATLDGWVRKRI